VWGSFGFPVLVSAWDPTRHKLSGLLQQDFEDLNRLALQLQPDAILTQLAALSVEYEGAETECLFLADGHGIPPEKNQSILPRSPASR
jgi:hypothetical protein